MPFHIVSFHLQRPLKSPFLRHHNVSFRWVFTIHKPLPSPCHHHLLCYSHCYTGGTLFFLFTVSSSLALVGAVTLKYILSHRISMCVCVCMYGCNHLQKHPFLQWLEPKVNGVMVRVALPFVPVGATCAVFFFLLPLMYASFTADSGYRRVVTFTGHKHSPTYTLIYR